MRGSAGMPARPRIRRSRSPRGSAGRSRRQRDRAVDGSARVRVGGRDAAPPLTPACWDSARPACRRRRTACPASDRHPASAARAGRSRGRGWSAAGREGRPLSLFQRIAMPRSRSGSNAISAAIALHRAAMEHDAGGRRSRTRASRAHSRPTLRRSRRQDEPRSLGRAWRPAAHAASPATARAARRGDARSARSATAPCR